MGNRTNNLYNVQVVRYAWIAVEAEDYNEAMAIADNAELEYYIADSVFLESEIDVNSCEAYSTGIEGKYLRDDEYVLTKDGAMTAKAYREAVEDENEKRQIK